MSGRIWPTGSSFPTPVTVELAFSLYSNDIKFNLLENQSGDLVIAGLPQVVKIAWLITQM